MPSKPAQPPPPIQPTHLYKGRPVQFVERSHNSYGEWYCTIIMLDRNGKQHRQSIQERHLEPLEGPGELPDILSKIGPKVTP